jgi:hypothetical protein
MSNLGRPPLTPRIDALDEKLKIIEAQVGALHEAYTELQKALDTLAAIIKIISNGIPVKDTYVPRFERWPS